MKLKPISKHIVNGSTLMGFGIVAVYLGGDVFRGDFSLFFKGTVGTLTTLSGIWFLILGIYEMFIGAILKKFFDCPD